MTDQTEMQARIEALAAENGRMRGEIASIFDWQPIETAPRDGTPFFTLSADAANNPCEGGLGLKSTPVLVMAWLRSDKRPYPVDEYGDWHDFHCYEPTHWSPMDAALRAARAALKGEGE